MALNWNAEKVPAEVREANPLLLERAIWNSMVVGVPELTAQTLGLAIQRTRELEEKLGPMCWESDGDYGLKPLYLHQRLHLFVGLSTNASKFSAAAWRRSLKRIAA